MNAIPDEIIQAGILEAEIYAKWLHAGNSKGSLSPHAIDGLADSFSRLILSERQRQAELMEEVRKVLEPFSQMAGEMFARNWNAGDLAIALDNPDRANRVTAGDFFAARALLSRLEAR